MRSDLKALVNKSITVLRETKAQFKNPAVMWSTGKDSTTMLSLIRESFFDQAPFPVIFLETGRHSKEILEFRDRITDIWNLKLITGRNESAIDKISPETHTYFECCTARKTEALKKVIEEYGFDSVIVSIRRDEHGVRGKERYMSPRDKDFRWNIYKEDPTKTETKGIVASQDVELSGWNLFGSYFGEDTDHVRVHPLLHWTETDVWRYIKDRNLPVNPLYFAGYVEKAYGMKCKRYRSLGCASCTEPVDSCANTLDEIIEEVSLSRWGSERTGRAQDKEEDFAMQRLRALGYM